MKRKSGNLNDELKMSINMKTLEYESPSLTFSCIDMGGLICSSEFTVQVDEWESIDGGTVIFDDDAVVLD